MTELNAVVQARDGRINYLESYIQDVHNGIMVQIMSRFRVIIDKLLRPGTKPRNYYELGLTGMRVILNEGWRSFFRRAREWLVWMKEAKRERLAPITAFKKEAEKLIFPVPSKQPAVSIIIPAYNNCRYTLDCLKSIRENTEGDFKVIVVDDCSTDGTKDILSKIKNLRLIKNRHNSGFVYSCNRGAKASKGKYILFLNNDTLVTENWLPPMLDLIKREDVGAVGSRLVYPDGKLQEAGGIIWNDGSGWNYGRGDDPDKPEYNYVREVDYCTGASLLVKRELFKKIGGLDKRFKPAYYEDSDLCFSIRKRGYRVMYQPKSLVVHFEGVTYNLGGTSGLSYTEITRAKFISKWSDVLHKCYLPQRPENIFSARDRRAGRSILVVDDRVPVCHQGAGFPRAYQMLILLAELGYKVTFFPLGDTMPWQPYTGELQQLGIEVFYGDKLDFMRFSKDRTRQYDLVLVSRPYLMERALPVIEEFFPDAALVYDAEAMFSLRELLKAKVKGTKLEDNDAERMVWEEISLMKKADLVIAVSENEKAIILQKTSLDNVVVWGYPIEVNEPKTPFSERNDILFIGAFLGLDSPNEDAILYFTNEIFPRVQQELACRLFIVGNTPPEPVKQLASSSIIVTGYVEDLSEYYEKCRVFVVPHRYSAGIPLKLIDAMGHGIPSVVSELTASQLKLIDGKETLVAKNTAEFMEKTVRLFRDEELWYQLQQNALQYVRQECNPESLKIALKQIINTAMGKSMHKQCHRATISRHSARGMAD